MMLHRHFEKEREENMTTTKDFVDEKAEEPVEEAPKRRGRPKKS